MKPRAPFILFLLFAGATGFWLGRSHSTAKIGVSPRPADVKSTPSSAPASLEPASTSSSSAADLDDLFVAIRSPDKFERDSQIQNVIRRLGPADVQAALQLALQPRHELRSEAGSLIARWAELDPKAAADFVTSSSSTAFPRDWVLRRIGTAWARRDPAAAKAWIASLRRADAKSAVIGVGTELIKTQPADFLVWSASLPPALQSREFYSEVFSAWGARDPVRAAQQVLSMTRAGNRRQALSSVLSQWGSRDPEAALTWAQSIPDAGVRRSAFIFLFGNWAAGEPAAAVERARLLPPGELRNHAIKWVVMTGDFDRADLALELIQELPEGSERLKATTSFIERFARRDPKAAAQLALDLPASNNRDRMLTHFLGHWGRVDAAAAMKFAEQSITDGETLKIATDGVLSQWSLFQPAAAMEWMKKNGHASPEALQRVAGNWAATDPESALAWVRSQPDGPDRARIEADMVAGYARLDLHAGIKAFGDLAPGEHLANAASTIAGRWASQSPVDAAEWAASLPDEAARSAAFREITSTWASQDYAQAARWLEKLPPGASCDAAISAFVDTTRDQNPSSAIAWAEAIAEPSKRLAALKATYARWKSLDESAANQWLTNTPAVDVAAKKQWKRP